MSADIYLNEWSHLSLMFVFLSFQQTNAESCNLENGNGTRCRSHSRFSCCRFCPAYSFCPIKLWIERRLGKELSHPSHVTIALNSKIQLGMGKWLISLLHFHRSSASRTCTQPPVSGWLQDFVFLTSSLNLQVMLKRLSHSGLSNRCTNIIFSLKPKTKIQSSLA